MFESDDDPVTPMEMIDALALAAREENAAGARRFAAIGDLYALRAPDDDTERLHWAIDGFCGLVAEISLAMSISRRRATAQLQLAITLRERLPKVAALYAKGLLDYVMMTKIVSRTDLLINDDAARQVDAKLAAMIPEWGPLSLPKLEQRIDKIIGDVDPAGVRSSRPSAERRDVSVQPMPGGMAIVYATLTATTAAAMDVAIDATAAALCRKDPRTHAQRRADALEALTTSGTLSCQCGESTCTAQPFSAGAVGPGAVIHVIAEPATLTGDAPGFLPGFGELPAEQVQALVDHARLRTVSVPTTGAEPGYRPSTALAEFIRCRDLTCRFPGCDQPAQRCDVDHTVPYPTGPTHPSNLKCLCRFHHLLKTFHEGWSDHQFPDGTVVWTAPTGHTYVTKPEGAHWFAALGTPTGMAQVTDQKPAGTQRGQCMPTRKRTRRQERRDAVCIERNVNQERIDRREREVRAVAVAAADQHNPPPF